MDYPELVIECALRSGLAEFPARAAHFVRQAERDLEKVIFDEYEELPSLVDYGTNWLLDREPEIYINAVLVQAYSAGPDQRLEAVAAVLSRRVAAYRRANKLAKWSGQTIDISGQV